MPNLDSQATAPGIRYFKQQVRNEMDELAFLAMFKEDELPDCETALSLLKMWINSDPQALEALGDMEKLDVETIRRQNPYFSQFVEHSAQCPKCGEILA